MDEVNKSETAQREEEVLAFWKEQNIFQKSLEKKASKGEFVFYDGPPFATGLPHHGHLLGSTSKDLFGRYRTMRGYFVRRRWGWDCHGLPIETKVEEKLGLKNKKDIGTLGVETFNETARSMVLEYVSEWKRYIERLGRWVDFDNSYKTMDATFTESVWWALAEIYKQGKLYEGRKVLMYCPKDETPLAKAEIAMDNTYKDVAEEAVTVRFRLLTPEEVGERQPTFILAWTTTPWTLPGNVALAVRSDLDYVKVRGNEETLIVAKDRAVALGLSLSGADIVRGSVLVGQRYEPLYPLEAALQHEGKKWQVLSADFVTTTEGTGVVHTAVMYGEDDFKLGGHENLPMVELLTSAAHYNENAPEFLRGLYIKKAEKEIKADLEARGLLFARAMNTHSYPHCHRCGTPLIYRAVVSWFIDVQSVKQKLLSENQKINWHPAHLKSGRFKNIVEGAPDWTISRNRFWASPLPIWKDAEGTLTVVGSLAELKKRVKTSGNRYFAMRHGESVKNLPPQIVTDDPKAPYPLTDKGKEEVRATARWLKDKNIDLIVASPVMRAKETAELVARELGLDPSTIVVDERIREYGHGVWEGTLLDDFQKRFPISTQRFIEGPEKGETWSDIRKRMGEFLYDLEARHEKKNILIVSHGDPLALLFGVTLGLSKEAITASWSSHYPEKGSVRELQFTPIPHNRDFELDYHLPYIDEIALFNEQGEPLRRVPEVVDSWVEAGAMPFAEYHYPFENRGEFEKRSPADFISEYIAQTRTWFYYLHVLSVTLFGRPAFTNVVTTGTILASGGEKMSKSKKNFTDPYTLFNEYGADAMRYYLMSSVVMQAEDFNFKDEELRDVHNKVVNILRNTKTFYELYRDRAPLPTAESRHVLDRWIGARLREVVVHTTEALDSFDTVKATRPLREFVEDFSTWYVRRSRDRVKGEEASAALGTLRYVLCEFSKLIAPVMPFIADEIFTVVKTEQDPESVHLAAWPQTRSRLFGRGGDKALFRDMETVRRISSFGLKERQEAGIKVRQPLSRIILKDASLKGKEELLSLIKDELNVKEVSFDLSLEKDAVLDTVITPELKEEGEVRELLRAVQDLRKDADLAPADAAALFFAGDMVFLEKHWNEIKKAANLLRFERAETTHVEKS